MIAMPSRLCRTALVATILIACRDGLAIRPPDVAGNYVLRSVTGTIGVYEAPVSGLITLTVSGGAERRVSYQVDTAGTLREYVSRGSYRVRDSLVELSLRADGDTTGLTWTVQASVLPDSALRLSYPRPADGTIVEEYHRD